MAVNYTRFPFSEPEERLPSGFRVPSVATVSELYINNFVISRLVLARYWISRNTQPSSVHVHRALQIFQLKAEGAGNLVIACLVAHRHY
ncbi:hypothetical protein SDJN02_16982 [Cucurbita argyrosperma subsp. argyrosperma]